MDVLEMLLEVLDLALARDPVFLLFFLCFLLFFFVFSLFLFGFPWISESVFLLAVSLDSGVTVPVPKWKTKKTNTSQRTNNENQEKHRDPDKRGCRQRKSTREGFWELLGVFEGYLGESFPCRNPSKTFYKTKKNQTKTKENKHKLYFYLVYYSFLCLHPSEGVPGVDLDMPDSILTSLDLRNHQKHLKQ